MKTIIEFYNNDTKIKTDGGDPMEIETSSRNLGWDGIILEKGYSPYFCLENVITKYFYFALKDSDLHFQAKINNDFINHITIPGNGNIWINPPDTPFSYKSNEICFFIIFTIEKKTLFKNIDSMIVEKLEFLQKWDIEDNNLKNIIELFYNEVQNEGRNGKLYIDNLVNLFSFYFINNYSNYDSLINNKNCKSRFSPRDILKIKEFIIKNIENNLTIDILAEHVNMSKFYFLREFKKSSGITPYQFLLQEKLNKSKELLLNPINQISDIAYKLGFSDQSHFSNLFKKSFGISPGQFKINSNL
ncbi:MAG: hypothetical protein A2086_14040 [Spirochaetes bacterium GWD1_27_9]|nr:MAG: hypothetical protein A2Z98_03245 [Spirochaetes bacterium GWB1_27_13]OHD26375.1 MAG: hypothetical protein A2Y34_05770 [Spirochaetes bacterium GWC1_27_15]OHD38297.1 MAG: hypothetical protein A2086_14040 [Spirochaetes bacterium GWD1_27_9]